MFIFISSTSEAFIECQTLNPMPTLQNGNVFIWRLLPPCQSVYLRMYGHSPKWSLEWWATVEWKVLRSEGIESRTRTKIHFAFCNQNNERDQCAHKKVWAFGHLAAGPDTHICNIIRTVARDTMSQRPTV